MITKKTNEIELRFPRPYALQREIMVHPAKRKVICAGRRGGKTVMAALLACENLLAGRQVLLSSTSQDQADVFWRYTTRWLAPLVQSKMAKKNEVKRTITFLDGGMLTVKTGRDPDALRGAFADLLVLDECAYLDPTAWFEVGAPMLADRNGDAVFISTPKRRNWFFELFTKAQDPHNELWHAWHFPSTANPHLNAEGLRMLTADMTEDSYKQEILAEFLEGQGAVFRYIDERCTAYRREPYQGRFVAGLDWAKENDSTVITVIDTDRRTVVDMDRFNGVDWEIQYGRVKAMHDKWRISQIVAEHNSIGSPNAEQLRRHGLPVYNFETTGATKPPLIESLVLAFDRGEITALNDPVLKGELMAFERKVTASGRSQYSAPDGLHDDCVISLALAWWGVINSTPLRITENAFYG